VKTRNVQRGDPRLGKIQQGLRTTLEGLGDMRRDLDEVLGDVFGEAGREDPQVTSEARYIHAMLVHQSGALEAARKAVVAVSNQIAECTHIQPWAD